MHKRSVPSSLPTRSVRRLLRAVLVGLLFMALVGGVMGFAAAGDGYARGGSLVVPAPGPGDRGVYRFTLGSSLASPDDGGVVRRVAFTFGNDSVVDLPGLPATPLRPIETSWIADDEADDADSINATNPAVYANDELGFPAVGRYLYGPSGLPLAVVEATERSWDHWIGYYGSPAGGWVLEAQSNITSSSEFLTVATPGRPLNDPVCGLRNPLQGRATGLEDLVVDLGPCELFGRLMPPMQFRPREAPRSGQASVTEFVAETAVHGGPATVRFWVDPAYPVPMQWVLQGGASRGLEVLALESFDGGDEDYAPQVTLASADRGAPLARSPRVASGLDETGILHPFPASEAWAIAVDDDARLEDFVGQGAYVEAALFRERTDNETAYVWGEERTHILSWFFGVTDGDRRLYVTVDRTHTTPDLGPAEPAAPVLGQPGQEETTAVSVGEEAGYHDVLHFVMHLPGYESSKPLRPMQAPATLPSAAALWGAWQRGEPRPNGWAFCLPCAPDWRGAQTTAVYHHDRVEPDDPDQSALAPIWNGETTLRMQWYAADGRLQGAVSLDERADPQGASPLWFHSHDGGDTVALATIASTPALWRLPPPLLTAALGLGGLIVALAYWVWPSLKGVVGQALFSRVQGPTALEHPIRDAIYQAVRAEPGIRYTELANRLQLANGVAQHHVDKLVLTGLLTQRRTPDARFLFVTAATDRRTMDAQAAAPGPELQRVLDDVATHPATSASDVARRLALSRQTVTSHVSGLVRRGLLVAHRRGRSLELRVAGSAS